MNRLIQLHHEKQSFWLDFISRSFLKSGQMKKMVKEQALRGMTSNPTIFQKAVASGNDYDGSIKKLAAKTSSPEAIFEGMAIEDIRAAADVLKPVFDESKGNDGYISIEVSPMLAYDTAGTINDGKRLARLVGKPNLMVKVPATAEGLPAIEELTFAGLNINITLLFSVDVYKQVVEAYLKGLERRVKKGLPIKKIASVASFFVSRVDTAVDKALDAKIAAGGAQKEKAERLLHKAAVANAKIAYLHYEDVFNSPRFKKLAAKGARTQRLLWASTGTKDKRMADTKYIDELIAPDTVNTMPPQTAEAFTDHGTVKVTIREGLEQARRVKEQLAEVGVSLDEVTLKLQQDGVNQFIKSYEGLLLAVAAKQELLTGALNKNAAFSLGKMEAAWKQTLQKATSEKWAERIWSKDAAFWKSEPEHQAIIKNSLGWLNVISTVKARHAQSMKTVADIQKAKFTHILLLGMGGSSLCPEVLRLTFGKKNGYPDLAILDSTEPASVLERDGRAKPEKTLFIVASKSGSTVEPNAFFSYFWDRVKRKKGDRAGDNFIAITDPGTSMERLAKERFFRHIVLNPPDIGGRYSALSFFGLLPAALMGIDVPALVMEAFRVSGACTALVPAEKNPGLKLGTALGRLALDGRDKVTFVLSKEIGSFGAWAEQLIAESTGKEGKGILPVESEPFLAPAAYSNDRVFVHIRTANDRDQNGPKALKALQKAGHPVITITLGRKEEIAGEFFRWEFATAVMGKLLGINPFDQPNVQEAKDIAKQLLAAYQKDGQLPEEAPALSADGVSVFGTNGASQAASAEEALEKLLDEAKPGDYVAIMAYIERNKKNEAMLARLRRAILERSKLATTVGFGPRFLHSTGQLHKGGGNNGLFIAITADDAEEVEIPGEGFSFHVLKEAQARGDWGVLKNKGRRAVHFHFSDVGEGLAALTDSVQGEGAAARPARR